MNHYDIRDYTTLMEVEKAPSNYSLKERKRFSTHKHELKSTIFKYYFFEGFFNGVGLSSTELDCISKGYSPIRRFHHKDERRIFTIHHIQPLTCCGETKPSNLIPLPRTFHDFLHKRIIDPQIMGLEPGERKVLVGMPDFSKITLKMLMDPAFQLQYHKFIVDEYRMMPGELRKASRESDRQLFAQWYEKTFGPQK